MFRTMAFQPGDGLKFEVTGKNSGIPTARLTVIPAGALPKKKGVVLPNNSSPLCCGTGGTRAGCY